MGGCGSYSKLQGFVFVPVLSMSLALTTFVGQNMGAKKPERVIKGVRQGMLISVLLAESLGVILFCFAPWLIGLFSKDPAVVAYGVQQARLETLFFFLLAVTHASAGALRGAGKSLIPMAVILSVWCAFRVVYIESMVRIIPNIKVVFSAYPVTWIISSIILLWFVKKQNWKIADNL